MRESAAELLYKKKDVIYEFSLRVINAFLCSVAVHVSIRPQLQF
jgi:hypothetical protein